MKQPRWESRYRRWGLRAHHLEIRYSNSRLLDSLGARIATDQTTRVLEVGCAPGRWLAWISENSPAATFGIDLNTYGLELSRKACERCGLARADAVHLPFRDRVFDTVFSLGLIEHFEDPTPILREKHRVLKDGGTLLISVPNIGPGTAQGWHWSRFKPELYALHIAFTPERLTNLVQKNGFHGAESTQSGIYFPHMQRMMKLALPSRILRRIERPSLAANLIVTAVKVSPSG